MIRNEYEYESDNENVLGEKTNERGCWEQALRLLCYDDGNQILPLSIVLFKFMFFTLLYFTHAESFACAILLCSQLEIILIPNLLSESVKKRMVVTVMMMAILFGANVTNRC